MAADTALLGLKEVGDHPLRSGVSELGSNAGSETFGISTWEIDMLDMNIGLVLNFGPLFEGFSGTTDAFD